MSVSSHRRKRLHSRKGGAGASQLWRAATNGIGIENVYEKIRFARERRQASETFNRKARRTTIPGIYQMAICEVHCPQQPVRHQEWSKLSGQLHSTVLQVLRIQRLSSAELSAQPTSQPNCAGIAALTAVANGGGALRNAFRQGVQPPSDYTMRLSVIFKILKNYGRLCSERSENFLI